MRLRVAIPVVSAFALVVVAAIGLTAVRSEAKETDQAASGSSSAVSLARVDAAGSEVTVPALGETGPAAESTASESTAAESTVDTAAAAAASAARSAAAAAASSKIRSSAAAASQAAASRVAASRAAASSVASSRAQASRAQASRAQASRVAASSAAVSRSAAASAAASRSAAAAASSAVAHPAPDTSAAVEEATEEAAEKGITQSVVVMNRQTGAVTTSVDADADVPAMSLFKLIIAADVIDQAGGSGNVDPSTLGQLQQMIIASDDSIAQDFYDDDEGQGDITTRVADRYGLSGTTPSPDPEYWGDVQVTAHDMASLLHQLLSGSGTSAWFTQAMQGSLDTAADGFDQNFGVNSVPGAGSKQGWGCCLSGVMAIHSVGFTANQIIVVLSTAANDVPYTDLDTAQQLTDDPGAQASVAAVTRTVDAALPPP